MVWSDFFTESNQISSPRISHGTSGQFYVFATVFGPMSTPGNGGAIYFNNGDVSTKLLIEAVFFRDCSVVNNHGGAIYINSVGSFIMSKSCGEGCFTSQSGYSYQFFYCSVSNGEKSNNTFTMSSCIKNGKPSSGYEMFYLGNGKQVISSVNESENSDIYRCGFLLNNANGESKTQYCIIESNKASDAHCIYLSSGSSYSFTFCNIIGNEQNTYLIYSDKKTKMENCCIMNNTKQTNLFSGSIITIKDSFICGNGINNQIGSTSTSNISTNEFTSLQLSQFEFDICNSSIVNANIANSDNDKYIKLISCSNYIRQLKGIISSLLIVLQCSKSKDLQF